MRSVHRCKAEKQDREERGGHCDKTSRESGQGRVMSLSGTGKSSVFSDSTFSGTKSLSVLCFTSTMNVGVWDTESRRILQGNERKDLLDREGHNLLKDGQRIPASGVIEAGHTHRNHHY